MEQFSLSHKNLQMFCAGVWSTSDDCKLILADIGVESGRINLAEPSIMRWLSIIMELIRKNDGSMGRLVEVLIKQYPDNQSLRAVCAPWIPSSPAKVGEIPVEVVLTEVVPVVASVDFANEASLVLPRVDTLWEAMVTMEKRLMELEQHLSEVDKWRNQSR